ncbi:MAG: YtxH domain-containing protein [Rhodothermales bacterium]|nr:YtxH domain-containing protein [Rhodothermales bacterium]MBO6781431.1 YtxH domain-containing protein [Rhodothermales bacterium]
MSIDKFMTGVVAFAGGVVAGILLAPQSGAETRERLSDEARSRLSRIDGQLDGLEKRLAEVSAHLREASHDLGERVKHSTVDQVLPDVPEDPEAFEVDRDEVASDLRHMPRK